MSAGVTAEKFEHPQQSVARRPDGAARRVLYAEDQVSSRVVTKAMLEKMGFEVEAVDDGEVAVEKARESLYDIILLDIEMPVMDGVTAARIIRGEIDAHRNTPILALSAFLADSTEQSDWRSAFDTAVPKPANSNELQRAMARAISHHVAALGLPADLAPAEVLPPVSTWDSICAVIPPRSLAALVASASEEMRHLALALSAAREAGEVEHLRQYRHALAGLARNFGVDEIDRMIRETREAPRSLNISGLFAVIDEWRLRHESRKPASRAA
jgi:CheY-like chemotaxis protein